MVRICALNNDEHTYEHCSCIQLAGFTYWRFGDRPPLRKTVRIGVRKAVLDPVSVWAPRLGSKVVVPDHSRNTLYSLDPVTANKGPCLVAVKFRRHD